MNKKTLSILGVCTAFVAGLANAENTFYDLGSTKVLAINDLNKAVGYELAEVGSKLWKTAIMVDAEQGTKNFLIAPMINRNSIAQDINNNGDIAISVIDTGKSIHGIFLSNNTAIPLQNLPNGAAHDFELNNNGSVIGRSALNGVLWDSPSNPQLITSVIFGPNSELTNFVNGFNDYNQMVGQIGFGGSGPTRAVYYTEDMKPVDIGHGFVWANKSMAIDINNNGQILATGFGPEGGRRSFIWEDGKVSTLKSDGDQAEAYAINDHGIAVGLQYLKPDTNSPYYNDFQGEAVMWDGHNQYKLNDYLDQDSKDAGWVLVTATDINNNGWVIGDAYNTITREHHSYILSTDEMLSPIPEPSTYLMLLAGLGLLGFMRYKKT